VSTTWFIPCLLVGGGGCGKWWWGCVGGGVGVGALLGPEATHAGVVCGSWVGQAAAAVIPSPSWGLVVVGVVVLVGV
jgi:hypothetical protein